FLFWRPRLFQAIRRNKFFIEQLLSTPTTTYSWSLASLWRILLPLLKASGYGTVFCIVDGLDECDSATIKDFLELYKRSPTGSDLDINPRCLFLFSSRKDARTPELLGLGERAGVAPRREYPNS
ncbi:hypothetical protein EDB81DRAFT_851907, partial [Dactylonectria macrodidyma]